MTDHESKKRRHPNEIEGPSTSDIRGWLGGWSREEALEFIAETAMENPVVLDSIQEIISNDPSFQKLFVRSLSWDTTDEMLRDLFLQFGAVKEAVVIREGPNKRSKGFGFVTFETAEGAQRALQERKKMLDGREILCHLASEKHDRSESNGQSSQIASSSGRRESKIFVHGLAWTTTTETLAEVFGKFGELKECEVVVDKVSGKSKGYGFVDYTTTDGAMAALREPRKEIDGRFTLCNPASERHKSKAPSSGPARFITSTPGGQQPGSYQPGANHAHMQYGQSAANTELLQQQLQQLQSQHQQLQNRLHQQLQQTPGGPQQNY
eukprot:341251_1